MTRTLTASMQTAFARSDNAIILLVEIDTDVGPVRAWTGSGDITFEGNVYSGVGQFANVSRIEETTEIAARGLSFGLSGIPNSLLSAALQDVRQGRSAKLWFGIVKNQILDNFVANGFFDEDIASWTDSSTGDGSIAWNPLGYLDVTDGTTGEGIADQQLTGLTIGKEYVLFYDVKDFGANGPAVWVGTTQGSNDLFLPGANDVTLGRHKVYFTPSTSNPWIRVNASGALTNDTVSIDDIIIIENDPVPLINDPVLLWEGEVDSVGILEGAETSTISVNAESRLIRLEAQNERRYTKQDQDTFFSNDKGFDYVVALQEKEIKWGRT